MGLIDEVGPGPVALDTAAFIYWIEARPPFDDVVAPLFRAADAGSVELVTSALTLLEVLVVPYRQGDRLLADRYEALLTRARGLRLAPLDVGQLRAAAHVRAAHGVRTPDALQLAAALGAGCTSFVTNDRRLPTVGGLRVLQVAEFT